MRSILKIMVGLAMLSGAIGLDYIGASFQSLSVLVVSMILAIAGTMVSIRGLMEFLGERF
ncbi:conserved hypothetical protein [Sulfolobus islandicus Y.N.15.51]|jgi:hypothetical protein|uniref:Uncharacterized protein n=1 Tax=Saccharolobus islandicus (strain Y.N.15.51 / Yellowstone \|nr:hypothetical protein [Sulfolobus islandicus]ACP49496.1 conserved hypothetical protein [Sulfolobus islandicus Y.N.15.51]PVU77607.1 hypothetical protein DDW12_06265 [Sulfolobus islandicus]